MSARISRVVLALALVLVAGCSHIAPQYQPVIANVDAVAKLPGSINVGKFEFRKGLEGNANAIQARGVTFSSPVNSSFADYFADAVRSELKAAGKLDAASTRVLTGTIEKSDLSAAGINTNDAEVSVRFKLADGPRTAYEKTLTAKHEWESAFMGSVAIPRAMQNYIVTLQMLLNKLYTDPEFAGATGKK